MIQTAQLKWDLANKHLINREVNTREKEVIEYFTVHGYDPETMKAWTATAIYKNGVFELLINKGEL